MAQGINEELLLPSLDIDNVPVVWSFAVDEYLHNPALVPWNVERGRTVCAECACEEFDQPFGGGPFTNPTDNAMPWVANGRPETGQFLGVRVKPGTEMALRNTISRTGNDDFSAGLVSCGKATLTGTFQVVGLTTEAVRYGYNWFQTMLRGCNDPCFASVATVWLWCDQAGSRGRRFLRDARVVEFQISDDTPELHACQAMEVHVTWEIEDGRLFLDPTTVRDTTGQTWTIDMTSANCDTCVPASLCDPASQGLVAVNVSQIRQLRPVELRGDKTWCPIGGYPLGDLQTFGGLHVAYPEAYPTVDPAKIACDPCATYGIRLVWREDFLDGPHYEFQTVRWANGLWQSQSLAGIPCNCPVEVVELLHLHLEDEGSPPVPTLKKDLTAYSGGASQDGECCMVKLNWTSNVGGTFESIPPPWNGSAQRTGWSPQTPDETLATGSSGWPPVGCTLTIVRPECAEAPALRDLSTCSDTDGPVRLLTNGTWEPVGWQHRITDTPWPPLNRNIRVADQLTEPYTTVEWMLATDAGCVPGGLAHATAVPPLVDPMLGDIAGAGDWCMSSAVCAYPTVIPAFGAEKLGTLVVTVAAGSAELRWLRWAVWERVAAWGNFDTAVSRANYRAADPLYVGEVPLLGAAQKVTFDGQQDKILLDCSLGGVVESEQAGFGPFGMFQVPSLPGGVDYIFTVLPHPWATPTDASYKVELVTWELP